MHACSVISVVSDSATLWTVACQALQPMGFSRPEYWSGFPGPPPGDLPDPGIKPVSPALAGRFFTIEPGGKPRLRAVAFNFGNLGHSFLD